MNEITGVHLLCCVCIHDPQCKINRIDTTAVFGRNWQMTHVEHSMGCVTVAEFRIARKATGELKTWGRLNVQLDTVDGEQLMASIDIPPIAGSFCISIGPFISRTFKTNFYKTSEVYGNVEMNFCATGS